MECFKYHADSVDFISSLAKISRFSIYLQHVIANTSRLYKICITSNLFDNVECFISHF